MGGRESRELRAFVVAAEEGGMSAAARRPHTRPVAADHGGPVVFLAAPRASFIHGTTLHVDGGRAAV